MQAEKIRLCKQLETQMASLKRTRPSMAACTATAIAAAHKRGAGQVRLGAAVSDQGGQTACCQAAEGVLLNTELMLHVLAN